MRAKKGQKVRVINPSFHYFSHGSICECLDVEGGIQKFMVLEGSSVNSEEYWMDENDYEIIYEESESILNPSMVVISWADWVEYQKLKNND